MKPLPLLWCAFFPLAGIWASSEAFPWTPRAWEFQFSWSTVSYISEFLYKIRGFDLKSDTCVTMTSSSLLPSFPHTFTSFSLGTLLCTLHAQSSLCRVFFTRPCQWYKIYLQCIYINTNSSSPNIYISSKSRHFKSISFIFSYKPDFAYVYKLGVCFSLQVFFLLNHESLGSWLIYLFQVLSLSTFALLVFRKAIFLPLHFTKCFMSACELQMTTTLHFFNSLTPTFQVSRFLPGYVFYP